MINRTPARDRPGAFEGAAVSISGSVVIPAAIAAAGAKAARRFLEFFAATIRNRNTREAYYRAACSFFAWLEQHDIGELADIEPMHVSLYIETLQAAEAGFKQRLGCHVFRATGITAYLEAGGTLENAQAMAAHESPRTTKLYDRTSDEITLDEVERITI